MKYRLWNGGVETVYAYSDIERSFYIGGPYDPVTDRDSKGTFTFLTRSGKTSSCRLYWPYGSFSGLTVSMDGTKFFLQGWENGIRCLDVTNGKTVWKNRIRHTRNLLVSKDSLVAVTGDRKLIAMSVQTGKVTAERTGIRRVIDVTEKLCMAVGQKKQCHLAKKDTLETRLILPDPIHDCMIDIVPAGEHLYALTETLSDTIPRHQVYTLRKLALPEGTDPALWDSRYTMRRWEILREACGVYIEETAND